MGTNFEPMGRAIAGAGANPNQPIAVYPGPELILTDSEEEFRRKVRESVIPAVIDALDTRPASDAATTASAGNGEEVFEAPAVVFSGDFDAVQEYFVEQGWSDELPVAPPTIERVERFLGHTKRDPHEVIGVLLPERVDGLPLVTRRRPPGAADAGGDAAGSRGPWDRAVDQVVGADGDGQRPERRGGLLPEGPGLDMRWFEAGNAPPRRRPRRASVRSRSSGTSAA